MDNQTFVETPKKKTKGKDKKYERYRREQRRERNKIRHIRKHLRYNPDDVQAQKMLHYYQQMLRSV